MLGRGTETWEFEVGVIAGGKAELEWDDKSVTGKVVFGSEGIRVVRV